MKKLDIKNINNKVKIVTPMKKALKEVTPYTIPLPSTKGVKNVQNR